MRIGEVSTGEGVEFAFSHGKVLIKDGASEDGFALDVEGPSSGEFVHFL